LLSLHLADHVLEIGLRLLRLLGLLGLLGLLVNDAAGLLWLLWLLLCLADSLLLLNNRLLLLLLLNDRLLLLLLLLDSSRFGYSSVSRLCGLLRVLRLLWLLGNGYGHVGIETQ
jgi:hypothetical protein